MNILIEANQVFKFFGTAQKPIRALGPVDLEITEGSFTVVLGRSGSGKSTFLNLLAGLDIATSGNLLADNINLTTANGRQLAKYRGAHGMIFQSYNLLSNLTPIENVMMGAWASGGSVLKETAIELLTKFNLAHRLYSDVKTLSGGEKQRVAIARSLINNPKILFCDEPTGALDTNSENQVKEILMDLHMQGMTIVMVTHNPDFASLATQTIEMSDGLIINKVVR